MPAWKSGSDGRQINSETTAPKESGNATGFEVRPTSDSHFAWIRTRLSADSTLMGWMRLSTTLIGFGFTIVQFFDRLESMSNVKPAIAPQLPRYLGLALIFAGVLGLLIAIWQYIWFVNYLHSEEFSRLVIKPTLPINRPALTIAIALVLIGAAAFASVIFRLS
jgi:putative membrane protein